jgi:hypothetical protein
MCAASGEGGRFQQRAGRPGLSPGGALRPVRRQRWLDLRKESSNKITWRNVGSAATRSAVAVHPLVDFRFAFETRDFNRFDTRTFGHDIPVAFGNSNG